MIEDKLNRIKVFIGKKVATLMLNSNGILEPKEVTLKSAWINKDMILVDFEEYNNYIVNAEIIGTITNGKFSLLLEESNGENTQ